MRYPNITRRVKISEPTATIVITAITKNPSDLNNRFFILKKSDWEVTYIDFDSCGAYHTDEDYEKYGYLHCKHDLIHATI